MPQRLQAGVVGCGWAGNYHAQAYAQHPAVDLVGVCDLQTDRAEAVALRLGVGAYGSLEAMLEAKQLDVVSVATPTETHPSLVEACLRAGVHVMCEKPLARSAEAARGMVLQASAVGRALGVNYNRRFAAGYRKAKESLANRERVRYLHAVLAQNVPLAQTEDLRVGLPKDFLVYDAASHLIDLARFLVGEPVAVSGYAARAGPSPIWTDLSVNLRFQQGAVGTLICSLAGPERGQLPIERVEIATDQERLVVDNICQEVAWFGFRDTTYRVWRPDVFGPVGYANSLLASIEAWIDAILDDQPPPVSAADGARAVEICEALVHSVNAQFESD